MSRFKLLVLLFFLCLPAASPADQSNTTVKICGSGDNQELLRQLAVAYEGRHPGINIVVPDSIGSSGGVKVTAFGQCDIGRLARPLRDKEKRYGLSHMVFAHSPVVFMVSANLKSITNITAQQVVSIFSGKMRSWQDMGGPVAKIYIANREKGDSSRAVIEKYLIDFALIEKPEGKTIYSTPATIDTVARHNNIIAYGPLASAINRQGVHIVNFEGVMPGVETISSGQYPLYSEFGLVWRSNISTQALAFINFLESGEAKEIMVSHGATPVTPENI